MLQPVFYRIFSLATLLFTLNACSDNLPKEKLTQFNFDPQLTETTDSLFLTYIHPVACPLQLNINTNFPDPTGIYATKSPILVQPFDTLNLRFKKPLLSESPASYFSFAGSYIGDPSAVKLDSATRYDFPFPTGWEYKIIQGYNGEFSHNSDYSRYAIDFTLSVGDTVCAARDGIVVGIIKDYDIGGKDRKYRDYANFITLYHQDGTFTQYVHLKQNGSFVSLGDTVRALQPIGLAGMTGFTSIPHLHFNALKPTRNGVISFPIKFRKMAGEALTKGTQVHH